LALNNRIKIIFRRGTDGSREENALPPRGKSLRELGSR
jgi:hypothetical protein